jgi:hypothetical protein
MVLLLVLGYLSMDESDPYDMAVGMPSHSLPRSGEKCSMVVPPGVAKRQR